MMMKPFACCNFLCAALLTCSASGAELTIGLEIAGKVYEGWPLHVTDRSAMLLQRDGRLFEFSPARAENYRKISDDFRPYSPRELREQLVREFGRGYEVTENGQYLVVHATGQRNQWAKRFDELYHSFRHYFTARGFQLTAPRFPLVAVMAPNSNTFQQLAAREGVTIQPGMLGYYSPRSNRVLMLDVGESNPQWFTNAETIIHEAAHQVAFNTGLHNRTTAPPRWLAEGLGMMFEAPGVWNSRNFRQQADRIHRSRLQDFRSFPAARRVPLAELIASDDLFQRDPLAAYSQAWLLTFYLAETDPVRYYRYLQLTAGKRSANDPTARIADFTAIFGENLGLLEAKMLRFAETLQGE